jgi:adenylosuccinate synthase
MRRNRTEFEVSKLGDTADVVIDSQRCNPDDVLVRVASYTSLYGDSDDGYVDVIIGGQFGSEGKGQIVSFIAREYDLLVRVGGPNAGHKVFEAQAPYTHHHLPSGTRTSNSKLLLGAGSAILVDRLLQEIADCKVDADRLSIDPQAIVITPEDIEREKDVQELIGSTRQGVGEASARKVTDRGKSVVLAKDVPQLKPFIRPAEEVLSDAFARNERILLEGTQGAGLSLHHGYYPYVTSRDTSVSGCLSEAGIPPSRVRRVIMVCRTYPIRVQDPPGGSSGQMSIEINLREISKRSGINMKELEGIEITSTTHRKRRIGEFDWVLLRKSALLNGPTDIALTFTDYLDVNNRDAKRIEQLTRPTIDFIEEVERVTHARVSLIATGFNNRSVIDRRSW